MLDVELALGRPPWLLFRLAASSVWALPCCNTDRKDIVKTGSRHSLEMIHKTTLFHKRSFIRGVKRNKLQVPWQEVISEILHCM